MMTGSIVLYLNPWKLQREKTRQRVAALRGRDGDNCRRCRRPMGFDLPAGHDQSPTVQPILPGANGSAVSIDNLCLCHARCNAQGGDNTLEVKERIRLRSQLDAAVTAARGPRKPRKAAKGARVRAAG